jgi:hypothetical protein
VSCVMSRKSSLEKRTGKHSEGKKGPFDNAINARMGIVVHSLATRSPMTLEQLRVDLLTYFSEYFGNGTLSRTPSDALRRLSASRSGASTRLDRGNRNPIRQSGIVERPAGSTSLAQ